MSSGGVALGPDLLLETPRLFLRLVQAEDADAWWRALWKDAAATRFLPPRGFVRAGGYRSARRDAASARKRGSAASSSTVAGRRRRQLGYLASVVPGRFTCSVTPRTSSS